MKYAYVLLFLATIGASMQLYLLEHERRQVHSDLVELSKIKYGIFNVDEWKLIAARIIAQKIEEFDLSANEREEMRGKIIALLTDVISELKERFEADNRKGIKGFLRREGAHFFGIFQQMERDIPTFADQVLAFLDDPRNRRDLKIYLTEKLDTYADRTFSETDYTEYHAVLERRNTGTKEKAVAGLHADEQSLKLQMRPYALLLYVILGFTILWLLLKKPIGKWALTVASLIALCVLALGLLLPMIEIDARIDRLGFHLLGEPVVFSDQVLFFKSKSILEVVSLMMLQGKADLLAVGFLVFAFSVLFPISKILATIGMLHFGGVRGSKIGHLLVFKTGKWSMADVMVVAIFMSYIGFSGIVGEQLKQLEGLTRNMDVLTTNHSTLQTGFYMFTFFVLLSLVISAKMDKSDLRLKSDRIGEYAPFKGADSAPRDVPS